MNAVFSHIRNSVLESATRDEECFEWVFGFAGGLTLRVSAPWRLTTSGEVCLGWEDHGQAFGLPTPLDADERLRGLAIGRRVETPSTNSRGDLTLEFDGEVALEVFNASCGYEGWALNGPDDQWVVAQGGGRVAESETDA